MTKQAPPTPTSWTAKRSGDSLTAVATFADGTQFATTGIVGLHLEDGMIVALDKAGHEHRWTVGRVAVAA